jgi:hypothetical protein
MSVATQGWRVLRLSARTIILSSRRRRTESCGASGLPSRKTLCLKTDRRSSRWPWPVIGLGSCAGLSTRRALPAFGRATCTAAVSGSCAACCWRDTAPGKRRNLRASESPGLHEDRGRVGAAGNHSHTGANGKSLRIRRTLDSACLRPAARRGPSTRSPGRLRGKAWSSRSCGCR